MTKLQNLAKLVLSFPRPLSAARATNVPSIDAPCQVQPDNGRQSRLSRDLSSEQGSKTHPSPGHETIKNPAAYRRNFRSSDYSHQFEPRNESQLPTRLSSNLPTDSEMDFLYDYFNQRMKAHHPTQPSGNFSEITSLIDSESLLNQQADAAEDSQSVRNQLKSPKNSSLRSDDLLKVAANLVNYQGLDTTHSFEARAKIIRHLRERFDMLSENPGLNIDPWLLAGTILYADSIECTFTRGIYQYIKQFGTSSMTDEQIVHFLFIICITKKHVLALTQITDRLMTIIDSSTIEQLTIIAAAYFKTRKRIEDPTLCAKIIERTSKLLPSIDPSRPYYCMIIKSLRYSSSCQLELSNQIKLLMRKVFENHREILVASHFNLVHSLKLMESYRVYDEEILDWVLDYCMRNYGDFRIKDLQYIASSLSNLCYKDLELTPKLKGYLHQVCEDIVRESREDADKQYFHLLPFLRALTIFRYYDNKIISYINSLVHRPTFPDRFLKPIESDRSILLAHVAAALEHDGQALDETITKCGHTKALDRMFCIDLVPIKRYQSVEEMDDVIKHLSNETKFSRQAQCQQTFPHQNYYDLVICKGHPEVGPFDPVSLMPKMVPEGQKHCLVVLLFSADRIQGTQKPMGFKRLLHRLMTKLGYRVLFAHVDSLDYDALAREVKVLLEGGDSGLSTR